MTLIGLYFKKRCKSTLNKGNNNNKNNDNKMYKLIYKQIYKRLTYKRGFSFLVFRKFTNICFQPTFRSNCPEAFCKKDVLRNFTKFTGNTCVRGGRGVFLWILWEGYWNVEELPWDCELCKRFLCFWVSGYYFHCCVLNLYCLLLLWIKDFWFQSFDVESSILATVRNRFLKISKSS